MESIMEVLFVASFVVLLPLLGAIRYAVTILLPAFMLNVFLTGYPRIFRAVQILSFLALVALFAYLSRGEVGRNFVFLGVFFVTFVVCFLVYLRACKGLLRKQGGSGNVVPRKNA
jgi:hypothetical protein